MMSAPVPQAPQIAGDSFESTHPYLRRLNVVIRPDRRASVKQAEVPHQTVLIPQVLDRHSAIFASRAARPCH